MRKFFALAALVAAITTAALVGTVATAQAAVCTGVGLSPIAMTATTAQQQPISSATCASRWSVQEFYQFESNGQWQYASDAASTLANGSGSNNCPHLFGFITSSDPGDNRSCYGTPGSDAFLHGFFGAGNTGSWQDLKVTGNLSGWGNGSNLCAYNWRVQLVIYSYPDAAVLYSTSRETTHTC